MEVIINLSAISEKMCIDLVREIIDNTVSATVHFKGKDKDDRDFVKLLDVQDSKQVTAMIHVTFGSLSEIVVDDDDKAKGKPTVKATRTKAKLSGNEASDNSKNDVDILEYFKLEIQKIKDEESTENYPVAFTERILGMTERSKPYERTVELLRKLTVLKDKEKFKISEIKEIIGKNDYLSLYHNTNQHLANLKISAYDIGNKIVKLYLSLYKD